MNAEEIKNELIVIQKQKARLEIEITELEKQLIEAEKPKLRHGDFGTNYGFPRIVINGDFYNDQGEAICNLHCKRNKEGESWLGNIFDLLKEHPQELKEFCEAMRM